MPLALPCRTMISLTWDEEARGRAHNQSPECSGGLKELDEHSGKDGLTVKKLIVMLLGIAFICASAAGCGDKATTGSKAPAGGTSAAKP